MENQILQGVQTKCKSVQSSLKTDAQHLCLASTVSPALGTPDEQMNSFVRGMHTQTLCPGLQIPQDFPGNSPWDYGIKPLFTQDHTELLRLEGTSEVHLVQHPQGFLISLMILLGLPAMRNINAHTSENGILMNIPQSPDPQG